MAKTENLIRALRLPFSIASILPFIAGSLIFGTQFNSLNFLLGLGAVIFTHLSANLMNDYADSKSGADWQDKNYYNYFGGSKLIQQGVFSEKFYLRASLVCFALATGCVLLLAAFLKSIFIIDIYLLIVVLAAFYSLQPIHFAYHYMGELMVFLLFGPALVMGGYFIQTQIFPTLQGFIVSLPFGLLTAAILFANEIPDYQTDEKSGKFTWVNLTGPKQAYRLYYLIVALAFLSIALNVAMGYMGLVALLAWALILLPFKAGRILRNHYTDKKKLMESSKLTILTQTLVGVVLILGVIF